MRAEYDIRGGERGKYLKLAPIVLDDDSRPVARLRCLTPRCRWVGYLRLWGGGPCPRCGGIEAVYA